MHLTEMDFYISVKKNYVHQWEISFVDEQQTKLYPFIVFIYKTDVKDGINLDEFYCDSDCAYLENRINALSYCGNYKEKSWRKYIERLYHYTSMSYKEYLLHLFGEQFINEVAADPLRFINYSSDADLYERFPRYQAAVRYAKSLL